MKSLKLKEENIIKDIRNLFRLKKEQNYTGIKNIRNPLRLEKKLKHLQTEYLMILRIFLIKKNKIIVNQ